MPEVADYLPVPPPIYKDDAACGTVVPGLLRCIFPYLADNRAPPPPPPFLSILVPAPVSALATVLVLALVPVPVSTTTIVSVQVLVLVPTLRSLSRRHPSSRPRSRPRSRLAFVLSFPLSFPVPITVPFLVPIPDSLVPVPARSFWSPRPGYPLGTLRAHRHRALQTGLVGVRKHHFLSAETIMRPE